jgi:hypothetical protein
MTRPSRLALALVLAVLLGQSGAGAAQPGDEVQPRRIEIGNLVYAGTKTSKCFSDAVLMTLRREANLDIAEHYTVTRLSERSELARVGAALMTGEGAFTLTAPERVALKDWLERGGFLLASASCSSPEWTASFRAEAERVFGKGALVAVGGDHPLFSTLYPLKNFSLSHTGTARFQGIVLDGRLVCLFSPEGLNDTHKVAGCCCCGGNEVEKAQQVVANALIYALVE